MFDTTFSRLRSFAVVSYLVVHILEIEQIRNAETVYQNLVRNVVHEHSDDGRDFVEFQNQSNDHILKFKK